VYTCQLTWTKILSCEILTDFASFIEQPNYSHFKFELGSSTFQRSDIDLWVATASCNMMDDGMSSSAHVPIELIHHIFNLAPAALRRSCLCLCRAASWAQMIISPYPHLLHTVVIKDHSANVQFSHHFERRHASGSVPQFHWERRSFRTPTWWGFFWVASPLCSLAWFHIATISTCRLPASIFDDHCDLAVLMDWSIMTSFMSYRYINLIRQVPS